ncbi:MAG: hypothetical protein ACO3HV_11160 [Candidatus Nanopelagicales bacterium]
MIASRHRLSLTPRFARTLALAMTVVAVSPLLAGCWQGFGASTTMQNSMNSGNGTQEIVGSLRIENATIVRNDAGRASLVVAVFNQGDAPDTLSAVTVDGQQVAFSPVTIGPGSYTTFGYGAEGAPAENFLILDPIATPAGSYSPVSMAFTTNGIVDFTSLVVPDVGYYAGYVPAAS